MDFAFDDDQLELQAAAADVLAKECPSSYLRSVVDDGHDVADLWATLASLDWPGLALAEADGGLGGTYADLAIVLEQLGYVGDPTPFLATTTQFAPLVAACGTAAQRHRFLAPVATGAQTGTMALAGADGRWDAASPPVRADRSASGWTLQGQAGLVIDGDRADEIAVAARTGDGPAVFVVPGRAPRATRRSTFDAALHMADLDFDGVEVDDDRRLAGADATAAIAWALDAAVTGLALTMVGACQRAIDLAVAYVGEREQFGVPVGSFQAIKHKAVDMHLVVERARALAFFAALTLTADDDRRSLAASMAKAAAGDAQRLVFQHSIQLFGGLGYTWENDLHLYLRRAKAGELLLGGAAVHRDHVTDALLQGPRRPSEVLTGATDVR
ncbi:MAG TPA: acyl-CoA dehydrogenase family protein [Acidimicrobiales bacterium]